MANYDTLLATIDAYIRANYAKAITGPVLNGVLAAMVDSLGYGYQFMGDATPETDPGRPDQNVAYIAAEAGTYEYFRNLTLPEGKVGLFKWDGEWNLTVLDIPTDAAIPTKTSDILNDSGFITNAVADLANYYLKTEVYTAAQVDQLVASLTHIEFVVAPSLPAASAATMDKIYLIPSAQPSTGDVKDEFVTIRNGGTYTWEQIGRTSVDLSDYPTIEQMNDAINAALTTIVSGVTVTVDANVGTPWATVNFSGGIMSFAFHNLKGETGAQGPQGPQGNTGSSVDYPYELVNNLTTDDATKGLSAAQGKVLDGKVSQLETKVDDISTGKYYGYYATSADLPDDATVDGFAYVGEGPTYTIYNLLGGVWTSSEITVNQSPIGNDEDIDQNEDGKLQFANRVYNAQQPNGMGYKILRKDATFASQVTDTNTIYEIRYPFNLNGASFTIPAGCLLKFNGGIIANGTLVGNNTSIVSAPVKIFDGITMSGTFSNASAHLNWWCVPSAGGTDVDVTADLQLAFDSPMREFVLNGIYGISSPVLLPSHAVIRGQGAETFKAFGFKALSGFTTKTINDPRVSGRTWDVSGMFYHYYDYKPYLRDFFIDARKYAKFCIEHVAGYSWCDVENLWLGNARFACMVQYACEQPIYKKMRCMNSHIGFLSSQKKLADGDIIHPSGVVIGNNNLIQLSHCIIQGCNYGMVVDDSTNLSLHSCKFAYNSISAMVLTGTRAYVSDVYSEGDGLCNFWVNPDTGETTTAPSGKSLAYLSEDTHTIGGVTTEGRLDGFTPAFDFKFTASATGVKACYRSPFFIKETILNVESAFVSYINRGRGVNPMPPTPEEKTYDGIDAIFLTEVSTLNLVNVAQYNHDNASRNALYAYVIDFVPSNTSSTLSVVTSNATRRRVTDNNTKILTSAPCNGFAPGFIRIPGEGMKWGYKVDGYPTSGLNQDIETRLRGAGYDASHFKYNYKQNVFAGLIKNIPLYRKTITAGGLDGLYFRKEELTSIFGNREQVKVIFYAKLLNDVASGTINFSIQYSSTHYTHLVTKNVICNLSNAKAGEIFRFQQIVFLNPPRDANIDSTWNYLYLRNASSIADTDIALTDLLFYDVEDGEELAPVYQSFFMTSGTTAKKPAATDVPVGFTYFDTDLGKMIVSNGTAWVNMDGTAL